MSVLPRLNDVFTTDPTSDPLYKFLGTYSYNAGLDRVEFSSSGSYMEILNSANNYGIFEIDIHFSPTATNGQSKNFIRAFGYLFVVMHSSSYIMDEDNEDWHSYDDNTSGPWPGAAGSPLFRKPGLKVLESLRNNRKTIKFVSTPFGVDFYIDGVLKFTAPSRPSIKNIKISCGSSAATQDMYVYSVNVKADSSLPSAPSILSPATAGSLNRKNVLDFVDDFTDFSQWTTITNVGTATIVSDEAVFNRASGFTNNDLGMYSGTPFLARPGMVVSWKWKSNFTVDTQFRPESNIGFKDVTGIDPYAGGTFREHIYYHNSGGSATQTELSVYGGAEAPTDLLVNTYYDFQALFNENGTITFEYKLTSSSTWIVAGTTTTDYRGLTLYMFFNFTNGSTGNYNWFIDDVLIQRNIQSVVVSAPQSRLFVDVGNYAPGITGLTNVFYDPGGSNVAMAVDNGIPTRSGSTVGDYYMEIPTNGVAQDYRLVFKQAFVNTNSVVVSDSVDFDVTGGPSGQTDNVTQDDDLHFFARTFTNQNGTLGESSLSTLGVLPVLHNSNADSNQDNISGGGLATMFDLSNTSQPAFDSSVSFPIIIDLDLGKSFLIKRINALQNTSVSPRATGWDVYSNTAPFSGSSLGQGTLQFTNYPILDVGDTTVPVPSGITTHPTLNFTSRYIRLVILNSGYFNTGLSTNNYLPYEVDIHVQDSVSINSSDNHYYFEYDSGSGFVAFPTVGVTQSSGYIRITLPTSLEVASGDRKFIAVQSKADLTD